MKSINDVSDTNINDQQMCIYTYKDIYICIYTIIDVICVHIDYVHINDMDDITTSPQP